MYGLFVHWLTYETVGFFEFFVQVVLHNKVNTIFVIWQIALRKHLCWGWEGIYDAHNSEGHNRENSNKDSTTFQLSILLWHDIFRTFTLLWKHLFNWGLYIWILTYVSDNEICLSRKLISILLHQFTSSLMFWSFSPTGEKLLLNYFN